MVDTVMPIDSIPDWEARLARQDAFWHKQVIDRPPARIIVPKPAPACPWPKQNTWTSHRERWMDTDYFVQSALAQVMNNDWLGDALPTAYPNLGPAIFSAFFGCELEYSETTSWSAPILDDWADVDKIRFSQESFYWKKLVEMTDALLETGRGKFYTGLTNLLPGGDVIAAFRDPIRLNMDLIESVDEVKRLLRYVTTVYFQVYDYFYDKLKAAGQAMTNWAGIVSTKKWFVLSNDFSCMISKRMFDDVFLPGIVEECRHFEGTVYHLDGPNALRHLDSLLDIKELNAIQWVFGEGNGPEAEWLHLYKKCQAAGKGLQIYIEAGDLDFWMENLRPEGLWLTVGGVRDSEHAEAVLRKMSGWR